MISKTLQPYEKGTPFGFNGRTNGFMLLQFQVSFSCYTSVRNFGSAFVPTQSALIHGLGHANFSDGVYISPLIFSPLCGARSRNHMNSGIRNEMLESIYFHFSASDSQQL